MFTHKMGEELAACFPLGKHLHLPDAGHLVMAEYPDVVNRAIAQVLLPAESASQSCTNK